MDMQRDVYAYEQLVNTKALPEGLNPTRLEVGNFSQL